MPAMRPCLDAHVGLVDAGPVDDQRVGNDQVERLFLADARRLSHPVPQHFAASKFALVAVHRAVAFHFGNQIGVGEPYAVAGCRPVDIGIMTPGHAIAHNRPPRTTRLPAISTSETVFRFSRLEPNGRAGRDVEPTSFGGCPVELERPVRLSEVIVASYLDRPVSSVDHAQLNGDSPFVDDDVTVGDVNFAGRHARLRLGCLGSAEAARRRKVGTGRKLP